MAVAVVLVLFVGTAPGAPDHIYTVTTTADSLSGSCDTTCTLPDAITFANGDSDASQIRFAIPASGPQTIHLTQALPAITAPVAIDGTTQGDVVAVDGGGVTDLGGGEVMNSGVQGIVLAAGSDGSTISGLTLGNFEIAGQPDPALEVDSTDNSIVGNTIGVEADGTTAAPDQAGILVTADGNTIGGSDAADGNVIVNSFSDTTSNDADGILVKGDGSDFPVHDTQILGNYVGLLADGTTVALNEDSDIQIVDTQGTTIGGPDPADGNVLAGAGSPDAIFLGDFADSSGGNAIVQNNSIGLTADGSASLGPESSNGIDVEDHGSNTIADNTIADMYQGIDICQSPDNTVVRNVIGSNQASGGLDLGVHNQGISIENGFCSEEDSANGNVIGGDAADGNTVLNSQLNDVAVDADNNEVSFNSLRGTKGGAVVEVGSSANDITSNEIRGAKVGVQDADGVIVNGGAGNTIEENSIHGNQDLGIELVSGANDGQPAPALSSASVADGVITVQGTYDFPAGNPYTIDVYQSSSCESGGAGETWAGSFNVTSNGSGPQPFTSSVLAHSPGTVLTATATAPDGSTSEFSNCTSLASAPNVFTVDTSADTEDGACAPGFCSLRDAINAANGYDGPSATIQFNISGGPAPTISPLTDLPAITAPVTIDGATQPATPANTPGVTLDGGGTDDTGLDLASGSGGSTIRGLAFGAFDSESGAETIVVESSGNTIAGNWVGVSASGAPLQSSGTDISVTGDNNTIGGSGADANVLVNGDAGIAVEPPDGSSPGPTGTVIQGNLIGFHPDGSAAVIGASVGIDVYDSSHTVIGSNVDPSNIAGVQPARGNLIADSGTDAIRIRRDSGVASSSVAAGNFIGVDRSGNAETPGGGNTNGIEIVDSSGDQIGPGNIVANSVDDGVLVESEDLGASSDRIVANSIYANGGLGIDLQGNSNHNIAAPVITFAGGNTISGTWSGNNPTFIELFANPSCSGSSATSGQTYLEFVPATPGQPWSTTLGGLTAGEGITATATDQFSSDTSEFSSCAVVQDAPDNLVVTTASDSDDGACTPAACSLRDAINAANEAGGGTIKFDIPGSGPFQIAPAGLPAITAPTTIDGFTQTGSSANTQGMALGDNASLQIELVDAGLTVDAGGAGSVIRGLSFSSVQGFGTAIDVEANDVTVAGNFVGLGPDGKSNGTTLTTGILAAGSNDVIGGANPADRNVIANADFVNPSGIDLSSGSGTLIQGNYVGTDATGFAAASNDVGIGFLDGATGDTVRGNLISGNKQDGIDVKGVGATGNTIAGNYIGTTADGTAQLGNGSGGSGVGVDVEADNTTIGGSGANDANVISGNKDDGVFVSASGTQIVGNRVGVTADGTAALGNGSVGIEVGGGDTTQIQGNLVSGNRYDGLLLGAGTAATVVGNLIGTDATGSHALGQGADGSGDGIDVAGASGTMIGGAGAGDANVISGNDSDGIDVTGGDSTIQGNFIGTDATGSSAVGNGVNGIYIPVSGNTVGGDSAGAGNVISGNGQFGVQIEGSIASGNTVSGNLIGTDVTGTQPLGNKDDGIFINAGAANNTIGGTDADAGNVIADNGAAPSFGGGGGVDLRFTPGSGNVVEGNSIGTDLSGNASDLGNANFGVSIDGSGQTVGGTGAGSGNTIAFNNGPGVHVVSGTGNAIRENSIHDNSGEITLDSGANNDQSAPTLTSAVLAGANVTVNGTTSGAGPYTIDVFQSPTCTPDSEGVTFVGTFDVQSGSFSQSLPTSSTDSEVTATATAADGSTSEFSSCAVAQTGPALSNLTVDATPSSAGAGIDQVKISDVPNAWLSFFAGSTTSDPVGSTPVGSTPVGSTPVGSTPVGSTPVGSTPVGSTPVGSTPVGSTPVGSTGLLDLPVGSTPVGSTALSSLLLSQIPLCGDTPLPGTSQTQCVNDGATWAQVLAGASFANLPLNSLTLANVAADPTAKARLAALPLRDVSFATTLFRSVHWSSLLLGSTPLSDLPGGFSAWCGAGGLIPDNGGDCTNATPATSVLQMDVAGQLGSAPVGSTPVGSTPVGSTPVGSTPVGSTDVASSLLANIPLADIANDDGTLDLVVDCTKVDCANGTLGDAYAASAIRPAATFAQIKNAMAANDITVNDILIAVLGAAGLPWEQLPLQGLQPYSQTFSTVHYSIGTQVDCSQASAFTITARLPNGFFPVNNSAQASVGASTSSAGSPTVDDKNNGYGWTVNCPAGDTSLENAKLIFDSWVGLSLGTFSTHAIATANAVSISTTGAPVTVNQNPEAGDPSSATEIKPKTLVDGHIAVSGEQAFYKVKLDGLTPGTRISAFLNVPSDADLDLTMSAPATPEPTSSPVGSTPVGSTPIEDQDVGFSTDGQTLSPDTLQDVPVGSTPVGSTPVGSTPVGSTSDNRGSGVNEAGAIITEGQTGYVTIGISGYNGAASDRPFVLRVQETPPPPLPTCPARSLTVSGAAQGTLPATVNANTKTLFILDKQRLTALYGSTAVTTLLSSLNTLASRSEVSGTVLPVDGNAAVRSAYTAWDASPCSTSARNAVVKSINDVVAGYRANNALPNLHYIVLVGSDEATPMADAPDPVLLSPEEDEASGLAFTTNGGAQGNALYASAAQNQILTDGAYGAFTNIPWLGRSLLLPQLSVSRLVESPTDVVGQITRYLKGNGYTGTPQSGVGTLNPTSATVTGYDFLADGSQSVSTNLAHQFSGLTSPANFANGDPSIFNPPTRWKALTPYPAGSVVQATTTSSFFFQAQNAGTASMTEPIWPTVLGGTVMVGGITWKAIRPWSATDAITGVLASASPASIDALNGHYNQYELEAADGSLATTAQATSANLAARILFTMGCHGGLNVADTLPGGSATGKYLDWPELYARDQAAVYIGNTGFGYGDTASIALSERLLALYARNLHSNADSVGEEWAETLGQYFATAGAYDVYDEKVMEETTFYGLPFWHFGTAPVAPLSGSLSSVNFAKPLTRASGLNPTVASASALSTSVDPVTGTQSSTVSFPAAGDTTQSQFGLYRPILPITSQEVTSSTGPATGVWIKSLASLDTANVTPKIGYPTIDLSAHEPAPDFQPIFFPSSPFTLEHSFVFGNERDYLNVSDQFRPHDPADGQGTERHFASGTFEVFYGNASDRIAPLISDVQVTFASGTANVAVRAIDASSNVAEVAVLVNDGTWHYLQLTQSSDPTLWTGSIAVTKDPEVFAEATDGTNVSYSANKGSNFTSVPADAPSPALITLSAPFGTYGLGSSVHASFSCSGGNPSAAQCNATLDGNPLQTGDPIDTSTLGQHTVVVTALDGDGNVVATLQRTYTVAAAAHFTGITFANTVNSGGGMKPNCTQKNPFSSGTDDVNTFPNAICSSDGNAPAPSTFSWQIELANGTPGAGTPVVNNGAPITVSVVNVTTHGTNGPGPPKGGTPPVLLNGNNATLTIPTGSATTAASLKVGNIGGGDWIQVTVRVTAGDHAYTLEMQVH
jgi:CSLREA domain-containing protein